MKLFDFVQFNFVIKGHEIDSVGSSMAYVARRLSGIGKDYPVGAHSEWQDFVYFGFRSAVKASAQGGQDFQDRHVVIAFNGCNW